MSPHLDTQRGAVVSRDQARKDAWTSKLYNRIPSAWYGLWQILKDYPAPRVLWKEALERESKGGSIGLRGHKLKPEQATLLAQALGEDNEYLTEAYAKDLVPFVFLSAQEHVMEMAKNAHQQREKVAQATSRAERLGVWHDDGG